MIETQRLVANKLGSAESRAVNAQQKLEATQNELMEAQRKYEEDRIAKNEEIELIMNDLERVNHNYETSMKQIELLEEQLQANLSNASRETSRAAVDNDVDSVVSANELQAKE